jgi:hypothetical protein
MIKMLMFCFLFITNVYGADYFFCKDTNSSNSNENILIESYGVIFYKDNHNQYSMEFKDMERRITRSETWNEILVRKNNITGRIWAEYVPSSYGESFEVTLRRIYDAGASHTNLSCKRVYRNVGRP